MSWLARGILEEAGQLVGMVGSIEHAVGEDLLTEQGTLWRPESEDPTATRECSAPFALAPYRGRYSVEETCPNGLRLQVRESGVLGGCAWSILSLIVRTTAGYAVLCVVQHKLASVK